VGIFTGVVGNGDLIGAPFGALIVFRGPNPVDRFAIFVDAGYVLAVGARIAWATRFRDQLRLSTIACLSTS
jgi:hypothetical protein